MIVGSSGPRTASIAVVGEKPGRSEISTGVPFSGPSGRELNELLSKNGISRNQVYVTNAVQTVHDLSNPSFDETRRELPRLLRELNSLPNLKVIIPMGGVAFAALSGFQLTNSKAKGPDAWKTGIGSYRGSILPTILPGRKMVPTYHPAFYMRGEWRFKPIVRFDIARALEESYDPKILLPQRQYHIAQSQSDLEAIRADLIGAEYISFDIELLRGRFIECIAFARQADRAYCIPITDGKRQPFWDTAGEIAAWRLIQQLLNQPETTYVTQNGLFDCWHLWRHGITTRYMHNGYDTMLMHRLRAPDLPHDLGFLVSIYTREPYYKDESGDWKAQQRAISDTQFRVYNCKDAACTLEVCLELQKDLTKYDQLSYYRSEIQAQWPCVTTMREKGMNVNPTALHEARNSISREISTVETSIQSTLTWLPNTKSPIDMEKLYTTLGIRNFTRTPTGRPKTDIEQLYSLAASNPTHRNLLYSIASLNELRTLRSGFLGIALDESGFYHPSLSISKTVTGRMASAGADEGGPQIQNIPKSLRNLFVPDNPATDEFTQADLKGAEAALLAFFTQDPLLLQAFTADISFHKVRGCIIYRNWNNLVELPPNSLLNSILKVCTKCRDKGETECNHSEYYMAKKNGHAFAYMQGVRRAVKELRKVGVFVEERELERIKSKVVTPAISLWHKATEMSLQRSPWLETPLGRKREFYGQLDPKMLRAALSWYCQATVGQITNRAMITLHAEFTNYSPGHPRIITQTHDSLLISHNRTIRPYIINFLTHAFDQPITIHSRTFTIPIELTHGSNWRDMR